jgi:acetylornithine deacetylase
MKLAEQMNAIPERTLRDNIVRVATDLVEIPSPTGDEYEIGCYLESMLRGLDMTTSRQEVEEGRFNVIGSKASGRSSRSLMLNAHMDTSTRGDERPDLPIGLVPEATLEDGWLYGLGISNMKAAFASYYGALFLLAEAGIELDGTLSVSGVVGEIEKAPIGSFCGPQYRGGGCGAAYGVQHGMMADVVVIGEPTGLRIQNGSSSFAFCRVSSTGRAQHTWARERGEDAIAKSIRLRELLQEWESEFQRLASDDRIGARLTVGAIEGGFPFKPSIAPAPSCDLYLDLRYAPSHDVVEIRRILHGWLDDVARDDPDLRADLEFYLVRNGFFLPESDPAFQLTVECHRAAGGGETGPVVPNRYFVSADASTFTEYGMTSVVYGPGGITRSGAYQMYDERGEVVSVDNMVLCARTYALMIADYLGLS